MTARLSLRDCYRLLELPTGASIDDVKRAYRRLARRYHPDSGTFAASPERFASVSAAYRQLADRVATSIRASEARPVRSTPRPPGKPQPLVNPQLSSFEQELKDRSFTRLQSLFAAQRFPSAIALAEGLAQRLPQDPEISQWQAIAYQRWGRELVNRGQFDRARAFLRKALNTAPRNRQLSFEVEHDLRRMGD